MKSKTVIHILSMLVILAGTLSGCAQKEDIDWPTYHADYFGSHYSDAGQITSDNVSNLEIAWTYDGGEAVESRSQIQCNPLIVDGVLYGSSATLRFFALDASNGELIWSFNPFEEEYQMFGFGVNRGLCYWESKNGKDKRIYFSAGSNIYALDASTGKPYVRFGWDGKVNLKEGLDRDIGDRFVISTSPGVIYNDLFIMGSRVDETSGAAPGHIRAWNIHTGEREWIFHTIPHPGEVGYDTWPEDAWKEIGGANAWSGMSLDKERGIIYVPTGSASYDFYGADRPGENLFANCVLALNAKTGERIWHFQTIHHDLWDRDLPAPPTLGTIKVDGEDRDVVIQTTKMGFVYVLDRDTGEPVFPVEEVAVPPSDMPGEEAWPTQPRPAQMPPFARQTFTLDQVTNISEESHSYVSDILSRTQTGDPFIPPTQAGSIIFPGFDGGGEWGGAAFNPKTKTLFVNANDIPWIMTMVEIKEGTTNIEQGRGLYTQFCAICHGLDMKGTDFMGNVPSLIGLKERYDEQKLTDHLKKGGGNMPSFSWLGRWQIEALKAYLLELEEKEVDNVQTDPDAPKKFTNTGYNKFRDNEGYPAIEPPWGTLTAIDIEKAEIKWRIPFGEFDELTERGLPVTGTENYGGPAITSSGLIFIAATQDERFRVIDQENGKILFETRLPAAGYATPSIYQVNGKQYVVIACGGGKLGTKSGDSYVAFSLPEGN